MSWELLHGTEPARMGIALAHAVLITLSLLPRPEQGCCLWRVPEGSHYLVQPPEDLDYWFDTKPEGCTGCSPEMREQG
jgi:hypothetical protein